MAADNSLSRIQVRFSPTRNQFIHLVVTLTLKKVWWVPLLIGVMPWLAFGFLAVYFSTEQVKGSIPPNAWWSAGVGSFVAFVLLPLSTRWTASRQWQTNPAVREAREYEFSDNGIRYSSESSRSEFSWNLIQKANLSRGMVVLWMGSNQIHYIPLHVLGPEQRRGLAQLFKEKLKESPGF